MSSSQCEGKKKAVLIAVRRVKGFRDSLPQAHSDAQELKQLLISKYDYAEEDIKMLLDDKKLHRSFWPHRSNIRKKINWLVEDIGERDRLVFYYSGHGGQTTCHHGSEEDGKDEAIYGYDGDKIIDNDLKEYLVNPVLKVKGCQLFALFDCCHSETVLDLKHANCSSRLLPEVRSSTTCDHTNGPGADVTQIPVTNKWWWLSSCKNYYLALSVSKTWRSKKVLSISPSFVIERATHTLDRLRNGIVRMLKDFLNGTSPPVDGSLQAASVRPRVSVDTDLHTYNGSVMSPHRTVTSPTSIFPNANCTRACVVTKTEGDEGHVVCISACRDNELAHDDNVAGGTLTKFFLSSLSRFRISRTSLASLTRGCWMTYSIKLLAFERRRHHICRNNPLACPGVERDRPKSDQKVISIRTEGKALPRNLELVVIAHSTSTRHFLSKHCNGRDLLVIYFQFSIFVIWFSPKLGIGTKRSLFLCS